MRGPGEVLHATGRTAPLRYADLLRDIDLLQIARREAAALLRRDQSWSSRACCDPAAPPRALGPG